MKIQKSVGIVYGYFVLNSGIGRHLEETAKHFNNPEAYKILTIDKNFDTSENLEVSYMPCKRNLNFLSLEENLSFSQAINNLKNDSDIVLHSHGVYDINPDIYTAHICLSKCFNIMLSIFGKSIVIKSFPEFNKILDLEKRMLNRLEERQIFSVSKKLSIDLYGEYGLSAEQMKIVLNSSRFSIKKIKYFCPQKIYSEIILGTIGGNFYAKGFPFVCKLIAELKRRGYRVKCVIVGCNNQTIADLKNFLEKENLCFISDSLILKGKIEIGENFYAQLDCYLCLSLFENHSLSTLEAMSLGIPVVSNCLNSVFYDAKLYDPNLTICQLTNLDDIQEMADAVENILLNSPYRDCLISSGFQIVRCTSWKSVAADYERLYLASC
jgi:glycosyltransferase involved in cell wall biosynthesis